MGTFARFPGEIRNQIYRYLLTDEYHPLEPQGRSKHDSTIKKDLHPKILRICKAIHDEAISIFYEENSFRFEYPFDCVRWAWGYKELFLGPERPSAELRRMKKVSILPNTLSWSRYVQSFWVGHLDSPSSEPILLFDF